MEKEQFSILYNGQPVAVTILGDNSFMVQVTYRPVKLRLHNINGTEQWVDEETNNVSPLTTELGALISGHLYAVEQD